MYIHDQAIKRFGGSFGIRVVDGNKRTALTSAGLFLKLNGWKLINTHKEEVSFAVRVDNEYLPLEKISMWLKKYSVKVKKVRRS